MEFEPLNRTRQEYEVVLDDWLTTPNLTVPERALVIALREGLNKSPEDFDQLRRIAVQSAFYPVLQTAARKALAAGKLTSWSQYASSP